MSLTYAKPIYGQLVRVSDEELRVLLRLRQEPGRRWLLDADAWTLERLGKIELCLSPRTAGEGKPSANHLAHAPDVDMRRE